MDMTNAGHGIPPHDMCQQHVMSCHGEIHQEKAYLKRYGVRSTHLGHVVLGQFIPELAMGRHTVLADEIDFLADQESSNGNGHKSPLNFADEDMELVDAGLFGFPLKALLLYQRNVFRSKDCECLNP